MQSRELSPEWTTFNFQDPVVWRKEDERLTIKTVNQDLSNVNLHRYFNEFPLVPAKRLFESDKAAKLAGPSTSAPRTGQSGSKRRLSQSNKGATSPPKKRTAKQIPKRVATEDLEEEDHEDEDRSMDVDVDVEVDQGKGKGKGKAKEVDSDEDIMSGSEDALGEDE